MAKKRSESRPVDLPPPSGSTRREPWFWLKALVILVAGCVVLSPALQGSWYGDDNLYLLGNPLLNDPARLWKAWFQPGSFIDYYPIEQMVQWYQWQLWGTGSPFNYLICNLALHLTSALLIWHLLRKLGLELAWLGGLLFAIFPLFVDTVGVSCELKNTLSLPPFLLALCYYLDFERKGQTRDYLLALLLFIVAMLCKITMAFFPIVILLYAWWKRGSVTWREVKASIPFFAVSVVLSLTTLHAGAVYAERTHYISPGAIHLGGFPERIALAGLSLIFYFGRCFLPLHPLPYYPLWKLDPLTPWLFLPWFAIALAVSCCWMKRHSWGRPVVFGLAFFVLGLAPFLGLNKVSYMCLAWVHDHFLYIPIIALIGLFVAGIEQAGRLLPKKFLKPATAILALTFALLGFQTYSYAKIFANHEQLWRYNLGYNPDMWMLHHLYAVELANRDDTGEAIEQERESLRLNPDFDNAWMVLGECLFKTGDLPGAISSFQECLRANPHYDAARLFMGFALSRTGRSADAIGQFKLFVQDHPSSLEGHMGLGQALAEEKRFPEAITEFETALRLNPDDAKLQAGLAELKQRQGWQNAAGGK